MASILYLSSGDRASAREQLEAGLSLALVGGRIVEAFHLRVEILALDEEQEDDGLPVAPMLPVPLPLVE
jgi:hypothetical protein